MKNGKIEAQIEMQKKQIAGERINTQKSEPQKQESQKVNTDLGLYSVMSLLTPNVNNQEERQIPMKKKIKKKSKRGFKR